MGESDGPLAGLKVLDLTRILAGPTCTQLLGDLGADVIKIENPATGGDDTRCWGPPYVTDAKGRPTDISAYFASSNRNKRSVAVDIATGEGQALIRGLAVRADVLVENFKPGGLAGYGLDYGSLAKLCPGLVYCSLSGFGQTGPNREKPGYDLMAQGYGGIMSLTGEPDGMPMKVGVGVADVVCGLYACSGILAALRCRDRTGKGQQVEIALVDAQVAWLVNEGLNYLTSGEVPLRRGNAHPNIVPYDVFASSDGHVIIAVGNDGQFARFAEFVGLPGLAEDSRFFSNPARVRHRAELMPLIRPVLAARSTAEIIAGLERARVPVGPVQTLDRVFASDQVAARNMTVRMEGGVGPMTLIGNPLKFSLTPVTYRIPPPGFGVDTKSVTEASNPWTEESD